LSWSRDNWKLFLALLLRISRISTSFCINYVVAETFFFSHCFSDHIVLSHSSVHPMTASSSTHCLRRLIWELKPHPKPLTLMMVTESFVEIL
jgi:hypothetical protein